MTTSATRPSPEWLPVRRRSAKRLIDLMGGSFLLLMAIPVMAAVYLAIKATTKGPVFYRQVRVGHHGIPFTMIKFRTMHVGSHRARAALVHLNEAGGHLFKLRNDPRITPVGRLLRRLSLDELPQLVNVLRGDMSLVGPRPLLPEDSDYLGRARDRLLVPPGVTGLWQVSGRSNLPWEEMVRLDLHYVENCSALLDLVILARTIPAVLTARGAH
ncbi:sugar transferase [Kitasatospora sp. NPDC048365]|uniref:sugar transferase n=1 Tax=Kitasatospora sp. NPDC048365 TaxID=3364050 RepID=UPI003720C4F7